MTRKQWLGLWLMRLFWLLVLAWVVVMFVRNVRFDALEAARERQVGLAYPAFSPEIAIADFGRLLAVLRWLSGVVFLGSALLVVGLRRYDWFAFFVSATLMLVVWNLVIRTDSSTWIYPTYLRPYRDVLPEINAVLVATCLVLLFFLFPNGRFATRWMAWGSIPIILIGVLPFVDPLLSRISFSQFFNEAGFAVLALSALVSILVGLVGQSYRYWRIVDPVERQQSRLILFALAIQIWPSVSSVFLVGGRPWYALFTIFLNLAAVTALPVAFTVAILRYRLWDAEVVIRRTVIYTILTGLLALIYLSSVALLQTAFTAVSGQRSAVSIVLSTLVIAALFTPLRRWIQDVVDRRFFRQKYDAAQTLARFAAVARDEVDLDRLTAELVSVVEETMLPEKVGLWLAATPEAEKRSKRDVS